MMHLNGLAEKPQGIWVWNMQGSVFHKLRKKGRVFQHMVGFLLSLVQNFFQLTFLAPY
jgi:hypothetical protein